MRRGYIYWFPLRLVLAISLGVAGLSPGAKVVATSYTAPAIAQESPTPTVHTVGSGETLSQIAFEYDVSVEQVAAANGLLDHDLIQVGRQLVIPSPSPATSSTPEAALPGQAPLLACPQNTAAYALNLPADPIRMAIVGNWIYLVADGDLYRMPIPRSTQSSFITPRRVMPPGHLIGDFSIRELVYVTPDSKTGDLLLLDKSNDIYRYTNANRASGNVWQFESLASQVPGQFPDPQFLAVQSAADEHVYALDADLQHIWQTTESVPRTYLPSSALDDAIDMAVTSTTTGPPHFSVLTRDGAVLQLQVGRPARALEVFPPRAGAWPAQILIEENDLYVVDAEERTIRRHSPSDEGSLEMIDFRLPDMGLLRSIDLAGETLYAVAGSTLYVVGIRELDAFDCPEVLYDTALAFYEVDLLKAMSGVQLPFENATLPKRLRSYPGARRLYRQGIHRGVDLYATEAYGLGIGSPVSTIADGAVVRAGDDYTELTPAEYEAAVMRTLDEHRTPPELMEQFQGRQVRIDHGDGLQSWYSHLASTAAGLELGDAIAQGDVIGTVGVSGTSSGAYGSSGGAHLHFEIWIGDNYLGHGRSLYETMRLWQAIFSPTRGLPDTPTLATPATNRATATPTPTSPISATPTSSPTINPTHTPTSPPTSTPTTPQACLRPPDDYAVVMIRGETINARTLWMLDLADKLYEGRGDPLRVVQGSYSDDVAASFGTHAGGGAVDISIRVKANPELVMSVEEAEELVMALRHAGFAAWLRLPDDLDPPTALHIHAISVGDEGLSVAAQAQITGPYGYFSGLDGVPPEQGGPKPDRYGGPYLCDWMASPTN